MLTKKLSWPVVSSYLKHEFEVVYPTLPLQDNPTIRNRIWRFIKQDIIAFFAPARFLWRAIKVLVRPMIRP